MKKVKLRQTMAGPDGVILAGAEDFLPDDVADQLVSTNQATYVMDGNGSVVTGDDVVEIEVVPEPEKEPEPEKVPVAKKKTPTRKKAPAKKTPTRRRKK